MKQLAWMVVVVAAACGKGSKDTDKAPPKFEGPLTVAKLMTAKNIVRPLQPWDAAFAKVQATVGPPTKTKDKTHYWAAMEGDDCAYFYIQEDEGEKYKKSGKVVGAIMDPTTYGKDGAIGNRAECLTLVGKGVSPEDPNAPGPRADGPAYQVSEVLAQAIPARSKWKDQRIRITGNVTQMMGDEALVRDLVDDDKKLGCKLDAGATPPAIGKRAVLQGTVAIREFVRGNGEPGMEPELSACTVVTLDCKGKVAEMHAYFDLLKSVGPAKAPKPWPTGDDEADAAIKAYVTDLANKFAKPGKASELARPMKDGDAPLLGKCPPALARHKELLMSNEGDRLGLIQSVGDRFVDCDCKVDMDLWLARQYVGLLAATGWWLDNKLTY